VFTFLASTVLKALSSDNLKGSKNDKFAFGDGVLGNISKF
jgi:hypothetical protein